MDQHTLDILEFHRIKEILAIYATSSLGKSLAASIQPETDIRRIEVWQKQVTELKRLPGDGRLPLAGIRDIRPFLEDIKDPASVLSCEALLVVHSTLQAARNIKGYLRELDDSYPNLSRLGRKIGLFKDIEDAIFASIDMSGSIKNNATLELHRIRKEIEVKRAKIKSKLQSLFRDIFADIGDEQSLQQNLSTFSSHLSQIARILKQADHRTLVLLDELGTGTDPQEGAALGTAIIDFLHRKGSRTIATTHLRALKTYAHAHPRIENASVEFDIETLQPTYRLSIGAFGSSNALAIAQRLGLPEEAISRASELVEGEDARVEDLVNALQQIKSQLEKERESLSAAKEESLELKRQYETMLHILQKKEGRLADLVAAEADGADEQDAEPVPATFDSLQRGDTVKIRSLNTVGQVIAKMQDKNKLLVRANMMKVEVRPEDLEVVSE